MRFLLDENISHRVAPHLVAAGHDAIHVADVDLAGTDDAVILAQARTEDRVLISCDHDFVQLLFASGDDRPSLILTRAVDTLTSTQLATLLLAALSPELEDLLSTGAIASLAPRRVGVRPLPLRNHKPDDGS